MSSGNGPIDMEEAKREVQENYRNQTGEELPDHVVENLELLSGASIVNRMEMMRQQKFAEETDDSDEDLVAGTVTILMWLGVSGLIGVYASRFFVGWPAQIVGGAFVATLAAGFVLALLWGIENARE